MPHKRKKHCRFLKKRDGFTLVELMVAFTLLLILMTAVVTTLSPAMKVFSHIINMSRAQSVSSLVMDKITNELSSATGNVYIESNKVAYDDNAGNSVILSAKKEPDGELTKLWLHYQPVYDEDTGSYKPVEWYFTDKVYMGNEIEELTFTKIPDKDNLLEVKLKIKNTRTDFEYERSKVVKCYKLKEGFETGTFPAEEN